jgi:preprotein translocase subunit SecD
MLNQYPLWKYILLIVVLIIASIFALPNLYGEDPAVQVSHRTKSLTDEDKLLIDQTIKAKELSLISIELEQGRVLARFGDTKDQLVAADALKEALDKQYLVALKPGTCNPGLVTCLRCSTYVSWSRPAWWCAFPDGSGYGRSDQTPGREPAV